MYFYYYWTSEFIGHVPGRRRNVGNLYAGFSHYPGVRRLAWMLLAIIFSLVLMHSAAVDPPDNSPTSPWSAICGRCRLLFC